MKRKVIMGTGVVIVMALVFYLASGALLHPDDEITRMIAIKGRLSRLTPAVNSAVRYKKIPQGLTDLELLKFATASNPALLEQLASFPIRVKQIGSETVLLLCSPDNKRALFEDISSTLDVDKERWKSNEPGCDFTINEVL